MQKAVIDNNKVSSSFDALNYVRDYSRHRDINEYIGGILGDKFKEYRCKWKIAGSLKKVFDFPLFLVFETMFRCNLKCGMCIHSSRDKMRYAYSGRLPMGIFKKIIEEANRYSCPSLTFGGTSEPLLDDNTVDMIRFSKANGFVDSMLNTNATLLSEGTSRRLLDSGLTRLRAGFDGITEATYNKIRKGADFRIVKNNIINFIKMRNGMGLKLPVVRVSCVHLSKNDREIDKFIEFWKPIVDYVSIQMYRPHKFTKRRLQMAPNTELISKRAVCTQPFERLYIRGNGDAYACCSIAFSLKAGNIFKSSIYDIWNSEKMRAFRKMLKNNEWEKIPGCRDCLHSARIYSK